MELTYTLLGDGASDEVLLRPLGWLLEQHLRPDVPTRPQWAELSACRAKPRGLAERIAAALMLFPCDLLFVHRDAESQPPARRYEEILAAVRDCGQQSPPAVCVVPVRMQEAWLLFDQQAIRRAAGNPHGQVKLDLPGLNTVESVPDPKAVLHANLRKASELTGRRLRKFSETHAARRVAEYIEDFSSLRELAAFRQLETDLLQTIEANDWK